MIIAYVYDRQWNDLGQLHTILWFSCRKILNDVSTGDLIIDNKQILDSITILKENNRISVHKVTWNVEKPLIEWYIRGFEASLTTTTIKIDDRFSILEDKLFYGIFNRNWMVKDMLTTMLTQVNWREDTGLTVDCDITDTFIKTFENGEIVWVAIRDARQNKYEFRMEWDKLVFKNAVWIDRSVWWPDYLEFVRDYLDPNNRSIQDAKLTSDIKQMANCAIGRDANTNTQYEDLTSINERWRIERPITNSWSVDQSAEAFVNERKDGMREYNIDPILTDFFACDVGDTVRVFINTWNPIMFFEWSMKILEKVFKAWEVDTISLKVSSSNVKMSTLAERFRELNARITRLELNQ
jgi:hypothetical protein